jgi:hypothetical protein
MSKNFSLISEYHCKQYFELFCDLIDNYFDAISTARIEKTAFNPESLLALIIDKIKEYNKIANESVTEEETEQDQSVKQEQENIYIGLL